MTQATHKKELVSLISQKIQKLLDQRSFPPSIESMIQDYVYSHSMTEKGIEELKHRVQAQLNTLMSSHTSRKAVKAP